MEFSCETCEYKTRFKHNLTRHLLIVHKKKSETSYVKCREKDCSESFRTVSSFRNHLKVDHNIEIVMEELSFNSIAEFESWKVQEESAKKVHYVLHSGKVQKFRTECSYYYCNRTGIFNSRASQPPKKKPRHEGTCKLNSHCTAGLIVTITSKPIKVNVLYFKTHYNHNPEEEPEPVIVKSFKKCSLCKRVMSKSGPVETIIPLEKCTSCNKVLPKSKQDSVKTMATDLILYKPMSKITASLKTIPTKTVLPKAAATNSVLLKKVYTKSVLPQSITLSAKSVLPQTVTLSTKSVLPQTVSTKSVFPQAVCTKSISSQTVAKKSVLPQTETTKSVLPIVKVSTKAVSSKIKSIVSIEPISVKRVLPRRTIKKKQTHIAYKISEIEKQQLLKEVVQIALS